MASGVFFLGENDTLVSMESANFASEADFQKLLSKFPELLSGDQIDPTNPRRWILVKQEKAVPSEENGGARWSLDHLFLDQDGVPTLVEVKRQTDTRIRREVVGQMLDYAANCVVYWPVQRLQDDLASTAMAQNKSSDQVLGDLLGPEASAIDFWLKVKTNLEAGRIRLLFVADAIPPELRRIIEFLNKQMDPAEVLGVELRQYQGQGLRTLVPLVVGQIQEAKRRAVTQQGKQWDEELIFSEIQSRYSEAETRVARCIANWMKGSGGQLWFGNGSKSGSMTSVFTDNGARFYPIILWTYGGVEVQFQWMKGRPYFDDLKNRQELRDHLNRLDGVNIPIDDVTLTKRPSIPLSALSSNPSKVGDFLKILDWAIERYRSG